jgi:hypothetical protein
VNYQPHQSEALWNKCLPNGVPFDKEGNPRVRYVRVSYEGTSCVMTPAEAEDMTMGHADYALSDVLLSEQEFEALPEFGGW